jgi:nucleoside phosphorylase
MGEAPVVLCALRFERAALRRCGIARHARLVCCGPGAAAVGAWAHGSAAPPAGTTVILAGVAGSLREAMPVACAFVASAVVDEQGRRFSPTLPWRSAAVRSALITSVAATLCDAAAKESCARRRGADLVDRESGAFAEAGTRRGWRWAVVRGVSDGPKARLPREIDAWLDGRGRARLARILLEVLRRPGTARVILRLRRDGTTAMRHVAEAIEALLGAAIEAPEVTPAARGAPRAVP